MKIYIKQRAVLSVLKIIQNKSECPKVFVLFASIRHINVLKMCALKMSKNVENRNNSMLKCICRLSIGYLRRIKWKSILN